MSLPLRPYQATAVAAARDAYRRGSRAILLVAPTGAGKCLGLGTPVLRYDGAIVPVESVRAGDLLMGPDSSPRRVLSTACGTGPLYRVEPIRGASWVCNDAHVLTLVHTTTGDVVDIDVTTYLGRCRWFKHLHKLFAPPGGVEFVPRAPPRVDPYFLGLWYGDGTKSRASNGLPLRGVEVTKPDPEVLAACEDIARAWGLRVITRDVDRCPVRCIVGDERDAGGHGVNRLLDAIRAEYGDGAAFPASCMMGARSVREAFLAGVLDSDGHRERTGFEIIQRRKGWAEGICYVARSLGWRALMAEKVVNDEPYWRVTLTGDASVLPMRIARKIAGRRMQKKSPTRTGFDLVPLGVGDFYGFELDGDGRFLLGDFTVTHNTRIGVEFVSTAARRGGGVLWLAHREELIRQARDRLLAEGVDSVGIVAPWAPASDAAVQVASVQTLVARRKRGVTLPSARVVVLDEAHHHVADTYGEIADHYRGSVRLGLTATPERSDGRPLGDLFDTLIPVSSISELTALGVLVPCVTYAPAGATRELSRDPVAAYLGLGTTARAFVFAANVAHAERVAASFNAEGVPAATVHAGTPWQLRGARLEAFRTGDPSPLRARGLASPEPAPRVLVNVYTLTEGVDVPEAEVCILARGCGSAGMYLQMVGRVLRCAPGKSGAVLLDLRGAVHKHGLPETDRVYSLTGTAIATAGEAAPRVIACAQCGAVFGAWAAGAAGQRVCPQCGADAPAPVVPRVTARELYRMGPMAAPETKARSLRDLCDRAASRGYKAGWIAHLYKLRFGEWPARDALARELAAARARSTT